MKQSIYDIKVKDIQGNEHDMSQYQGKVLLIVNTASACGFTPQYQDLEALYQNYKDQGLVVLGFPCNQFGAQEKGNEAAIQSFCELNFGVSFPLFSKIEVNGDNASELFEHLKQAAPGLLGSTSIKWNFTKFLVSSDAKSITRFAPKTKPSALEGEIKKLL